MDAAGEVAFGLCDSGMGSPEIGDIALRSLAQVRGMMNFPIAQDLHFHADKSLSAYAREARMAGRIQA